MIPTTSVNSWLAHSDPRSALLRDGSSRRWMPSRLTSRVQHAQLADGPDRRERAGGSSVCTLFGIRGGGAPATTAPGRRGPVRDVLPGPNTGPNLEHELRRWLAVNPRADAAAGFR